MATINGARAIGMEDRLGSIEPDKLADLIVIDCNNANIMPFNEDTLIDTLVINNIGSNVDITMVNGKVIYEKGKISTLDKNSVIRNAQNTSNKICTELVKKVEQIC